MNTPNAGLWAMLFADLVIEAMVNPDQPRPLCCLPIMLKAKYYPWVLIIIFSLIFGFQIDFWCGLAVGYMWHYGLLNRCAVGTVKATEWESCFPFKYWVEKEYFVRATTAEESGAGGSGPVGAVLNSGSGGGNSSSSFPMPGGGAAAANSSSATFKSFSGRGVSLGGSGDAPSGGVINSILSRNNASESRGRSTPETRSAQDGDKRTRNLAHESKLVMNSNRSSTTAGATLATDVDDLEGHPVEPQDSEKKRKDDKGDGDEYHNLTQDSNNS